MSKKVKGEVKVLNDLAAAMVEKLDIHKRDAILYTKTVFEIIGDEIKTAGEGDSVKLHGIGVLTKSKTKAGTRRNPKTQQPVQVPSRNTVKFRTLPKFRTDLNI